MSGILVSNYSTSHTVLDGPLTGLPFHLENKDPSHAALPPCTTKSGHPGNVKQMNNRTNSNKDNVNNNIIIEAVTYVGLPVILCCLVSELENI